MQTFLADTTAGAADTAADVDTTPAGSSDVPARAGDQGEAASSTSTSPPSTPAAQTATSDSLATVDDDLAGIYEVEQLLPELAKLLHQSTSQLLDLPTRSWPQMRTIGFIYHHGPCPLRDVAAGAGVSVAAASEMVERLVEEGIVQREPHPTDRRQVLLSLTARALEVGDNVHRLRFAQVTHALHAMDAPDRPALLQALRVMVAALRRDPQEVLDWFEQQGLSIPPPPRKLAANLAASAVSAGAATGKGKRRTTTAATAAAEPTLDDSSAPAAPPVPDSG